VNLNFRHFLTAFVCLLQLNPWKEIDFRGIMVIKTATKTKSKQRKDAVRNWKVGSFVPTS